MKTLPVHKVRCAIYTRVSTDAGIDQEFNSLDNQPYVKSQAHEGWRLLPARYDDGGFSGGSLERPALQQLLADIRARLIDVVVVYKVDRLTRSLADFAKLVELFDTHQVSFVSVTQSFNTTSSMGRLTLNVLLSFAQFEREVTGERIRDKVAASKKKGIWMGGLVPLGYRVQERKLVVDEAEAATVRLIFERYCALGSLTRLVRDLRHRGVVTKQRPLSNGRVRGGIAFTGGPARYLLKNRTYLGEIVHRGEPHNGEHDAIIPHELFEAVQQRLAAGRRCTSGRRQASAAALLTGKIFDDRGNRMTPTHANKGGRRYRYYVSCALQQGRAEEAGSVRRVPAGEIEEAVLRVLRARYPEDLEDGSLVERQLARVILRPMSLDLRLRSDRRGDEEAVTPDGEQAVSSIDVQLPCEVVIPWSWPRSTRRREIIQAGGDPGDDPRPFRAERRATLLRAVALGRRWLAELMDGSAASPEVIAQREHCSKRHVSMTVALAFLSPGLVRAAVAGQLPRGTSLGTFADLPAEWSKQQQLLG